MRKARWIPPLVCTVLAYGLAQGLYKQASLTAGQFCLLFVLAKTVANWGYALLCRRPLRAHAAEGPHREAVGRRGAAPGDGRFYRVAFLGQLVNGLGWICYFLALDRGPAALVGTVTAAYTGVTVILALLFLRERPSRAQLAGVAILIGCGMLLAFTVAGGGEGGGGGGRAGWLPLSLLTLLLWGTAVCIFKHAYALPGADDHRFFVTNWAGAALTLLPYGLWASFSAGGAAGLPAGGGLLLGALIVALYAVGDLTLFAALRRGPAALVTPLSGLYPVPTLAWAALVLGERISGPQWLAALLTLVGIVLITR